MRSFFSVLALVAAATAANMGAMDEAQACAMKTLLSSSACNTGDAACLCSENAREAVMGEINSACGSAQGEQARKLAADACSKQKMRRAYMPSGTAQQHGAMASPSASASSAARMNSAQQASNQEGCSCAANTPMAEDPSSPSMAAVDSSDSARNSNSNSNNKNSGMTGASNSRMHAPSYMATPSSSAARFGVMATPAASSSHVPNAKPSDADAFSPFTGAAAQVVPSMSVVVGCVLAGVVGVFAAL